MLEELRSQLTALDMELLELVAKRQEVVKAIGRHKRETGVGTRDYAREKQVIDAAHEQARKVGIDTDLAERLMKTLITSSLESQEQDCLQMAAHGDGRSALVIGGGGRMGHWFAEFLDSQGFHVSISDTADVDSAFSQLNPWQAAIKSFELIVVATPIKVSAQILAELAEIHPPGLIFDIASLKSPLRKPLRSLTDAGCRSCSIHPMFGPDTRLLSGRHVVFIDIGNSRAVSDAKALFAGTMVAQVDMELEDHDRLIAYILGLSHVLNISFVTALGESGEAAQRLAGLSSTTFDAQLSVAQAVAQDNPRMYFEIQALNDYRLAPLNALIDALERIKGLIERQDEAGFVKLMEQGRDFFDHRRQKLKND